jgi:hypothetical protein
MSVEQLLRRKFGDNKVRKTKGRNGLEFRVCCPFPHGPDGPDRKYKLYINPERFGGVYNCYSCGKAGKLNSLIGEFKNMPVNIAPTRDEPLPDNVEGPGYTIPVDELDSAHPAIVYLERTRKRPFDKHELSRDYGVRYCLKGRSFGGAAKGFWYDTSNTLIFPVWMQGRLVGWQSRLLYDPDKAHCDDAACACMGFPKDADGEWIRPPKYWTNPGLPKGRVLFNFDNARKFKHVVVTEGVFDAMSVGLPGVATFGKGVTDNQIRMLKTYWDTVILLLDPGDADKETAKIVSAMMMSVVEVVPVNLKIYKDAGDTPRDELWRQITETVRQRNLDAAAAMDNYAKERQRQ